MQRTHPSMTLIINQKKADAYILGVIEDYAAFPKKINAIFSAVKAGRLELFDEAFKKYLLLNQKAEDFSKIEWIENGAIIQNSDANMGDINVGKWQRILVLVQSSGIGLGSCQSEWLVQRIEAENQFGNHIRMRKFFSR